jgi:hypothetical protein
MTSFEPDGVYAGIPYRVLTDNSIEAMLPGGLVKFKNLDQLLASVNGPPIDVTRSFDVLGNADTRNGGLPTLARPLDYYSLLLDAIKKAERNSAQLRALVYERARFNFKRDILFGHSSLGMADLVRHINDFELAVARIEATADIDEPSTADREQEIDEPSTAYREKEIDEPSTAYRAKEHEAAVDHDKANASNASFDDEPSIVYPEQAEPIEAAPSPSTSAVEVFSPRRVAPLHEWLAPTRMRDFLYEQRPSEFLPYRRSAIEKFGFLAFGLAFIGAVIVLASMLWLPGRAPQQVKIVTPPPKPVVAATENVAPAPKVVAPPPKPAPPKLPFPLPTSFGIYALNDNKLIELQTLPISVPDSRVALSAGIKEPSTKIISGNKPAFILFRRDFRNNVPQKITLRVIARTVRETKIVNGKATVNKLDGPWRVRNISQNLSVSPIAGAPEMLMARLGDGESLAAGRYALVIDRTGYDFQIKGPIESKEFCLEGFETTNGSIYTQCKTL